MNIVVTGGGTGGHIYPAISIAEYIKSNYPEYNVLYIGSTTGSEKEAVKKYNINFAEVPASPLNKILSINFIKYTLRLLNGINKAKHILNSFNADIVFGTGGYVCFPVYRAQKKRQKPIVIYDPNAMPGKSNRQIASYAERIFTSFEMSAEYFPKEKTVQTGPLIRDEFNDINEKRMYADEFNIEKDKFTILACGGSQGAQSINNAIIDILKKYKNKDIQIIHQTGKDNINDVINQIPKDSNIVYRPFDYIQMSHAFNCADIIISRAGASTISEILAAAIPSILIPYPYAADNHQYYNAKSCEDNGAAVIIKDTELTGDLLIEKIEEIRNASKLETMKKCASEMFIKDADKKITEIMIEIVNASKE